MSDAVPAALLAACACAGVAVVEVSACVPDLPLGPAAAEAADVDVSAGDGATSPCGDGFIDLEAGEQCDPGPMAGEAGASVCSMCRMLCPGGFVWAGANDHCYVLSGTTVDIGTGTTNCENLKGHVVTFASDAEFDAVTKKFGTSADPFWVGLEQGPERYVSIAAYEPGWSPDCSGCYARAPGNGQLLPRADAGADAAPSAEACVRSRSDPEVASWEEHPCAGADKLHVLCEREPAGILSQGCEAGVCFRLVWTFHQKTYVFRENPLTADDAEAACASLGGTLVVLQSRDEREQLWHELAQLAPPVGLVPAIWVGLSMEAAADGGPGGWVWEDSTPADAPDAYPPPWAVDQPRPAEAGQRAFLAALTAPPTVDSTLAQTETNPQTTLPYVCQIPVTVP